MSSTFGNTKNARPSANGAWFKEGEFVVDVMRISYGRTKDPKKPKGTAFLTTEHKIVESTNKEVVSGAKRTWMVKKNELDDEESVTNQLFDTNSKNFFDAVLQALGLSVASIAAMTAEKYGAACDELCGSEQHATKMGVRLRVLMTVIKTRDGNDFTTADWSPVGLAKSKAA